ncbi:MAG: hypothetical protein IAG13_03225 [Deltaproteobacteria bacterium]|nr:hypothetical protein [Nannocystaceae bacterium]
MIFIVVVLSACGGSRREGDACHRRDADECIDAAALWDCRSGEWSRVACADYCASQGLLADGCLVGEDADTCQCIAEDERHPDCDAATAPAPRCIGAWAREACIDNRTRIESCRGFCGTAGRYAGCFFDREAEEGRCECVEAGAPCETPGYPACVAELSLYFCADDGGWQWQPCEELCWPDGVIGCFEGYDGVDACACGSATTTG